MVLSDVIQFKKAFSCLLNVSAIWNVKDAIVWV
jgi:hypothetical protein